MLLEILRMGSCQCNRHVGHKLPGNINHDLYVKLSVKKNVNEHLMSTYCIPGIIDTGDITIKKIVKNPYLQ